MGGEAAFLVVDMMGALVEKGGEAVEGVVSSVAALKAVGVVLDGVVRGGVVRDGVVQGGVVLDGVVRGGVVLDGGERLVDGVLFVLEKVVEVEGGGEAVVRAGERLVGSVLGLLQMYSLAYAERVALLLMQVVRSAPGSGLVLASMDAGPSLCAAFIVAESVCGKDSELAGLLRDATHCVVFAEGATSRIPPRGVSGCSGLRLAAFLLSHTEHDAGDYSYELHVGLATLSKVMSASPAWPDVVIPVPGPRLLPLVVRALGNPHLRSRSFYYGLHVLHACASRSPRLASIVASVPSVTSVLGAILVDVARDESLMVQVLQVLTLIAQHEPKKVAVLVGRSDVGRVLERALASDQSRAQRGFASLQGVLASATEIYNQRDAESNGV